MPIHARQRSYEDEQSSTCSDTTRRYSDSEQSQYSYRSCSTAPTEYDYNYSKPRNQLDHVPEVSCQEKSSFDTTSREPMYFDPKSSVETYASTVPSVEDFDAALLDPQPAPYQSEAYFSDALPTTPADFAELFPSTRRLVVAHDDSTPDGNMNVRVNTQVKTSKGRIQNMTLFHLRMHDLKNREFSLRRYHRDSGREVCHSVRKYRKPSVEKRPGFHRSLSSALATFRSKSDHKEATRTSLNRTDSGYESIGQGHHVTASSRPTNSSSASSALSQIPTNTTRLEFSNYAQVEVKRRGTKSGKRYDFDYWGQSYFWKQVSHKDSAHGHFSYHLFRSGSDQPLAHIVPEPLSTSQKREETSRGGWVPPCSMWISDERICDMQSDVSDVIIASGLIALVDGCIKTHFHRKQARQLLIPFSKLNMDLELGGPKRFLAEALGRPSTSHGTPSHRATPLRQISYDR